MANRDLPQYCRTHAATIAAAIGAEMLQQRCSEIAANHRWEAEQKGSIYRAAG
jgi:hypothetical protein